MQRLRSIDPQPAVGRTRQLLDQVNQTLGSIPNTIRVMANSPAVLDSFLQFHTAMSQAGIGASLHHQVKLATSETNECHYCTSILSTVAPTAGLSADDILAARVRQSEDQRSKAALAFAHDVLESRGKVDDSQLAAVRKAGFDDGEIVEITASVVLGCLTNFLNNVADTQLDIPAAPSLPANACCASDVCSTS